MRRSQPSGSVVRLHRPASPLDRPLGDPARARLLGGLCAGLAHAALISGAWFVPPPAPPARGPALAITHVVDLLPPPAPSVPVEPPPVAQAARARGTGRARASSAPAATHVAAAQSAQVITAADSEPVDFGDTFVQGSAARYAGGTSATQGTAAMPVRAEHAFGSSVSTPACVPERPRLAEGLDWDCATPEGAPPDGAVVVELELSVAASGAVDAVHVHRDPGRGFGAAAQRCARTKRFRPARDCEGRAMAARTRVLVRFDR